MKKLLLLITLVAATFSIAAQTDKGEKSVLFQTGFQTDPTRFMLGIQGRYNIIDNLAVAPDVLFMFPKDKVTGLDVNVNFHYVFPLESNFSVYPLAGLAMQNNRYAGETIGGVKHGSNSHTDWGFNLGLGGSYELSLNSFINLELKYTFSDADCFTFGVGYGIKF